MKDISSSQSFGCAGAAFGCTGAACSSAGVAFGCTGAAEGLYLAPLRVPLELLEHSLELLKRFFNIQRASRSLAKTGFYKISESSAFSSVFDVFTTWSDL